MSIWEHLDELRERVLVAAGASGVAILGCFVVARDVRGEWGEGKVYLAVARDAGAAQPGAMPRCPSSWMVCLGRLASADPRHRPPPPASARHFPGAAGGQPRRALPAAVTRRVFLHHAQGGAFARSGDGATFPRSRELLRVVWVWPVPACPLQMGACLPAPFRWGPARLPPSDGPHTTMGLTRSLVAAQWAGCLLHVHFSLLLLSYTTF